MVKQFKTVDHNNKTGRDRRTCQFYEELGEILLEKPNIVPDMTLSSEAATENFLKISVLFFHEHLFLEFSGDLMC